MQAKVAESLVARSVPFFDSGPSTKGPGWTAEVSSHHETIRTAHALNALGIVSESEQMMGVFRTIQRVAKATSTVLVLGESGTGKELIAKALHNLSGRTGKLVAVNCGAIPEEILESELFGHERGSFTGAIASKVGKFQQADGGTIFLDEIGEMSPKLQVKLLRVLQERKVDPVGSQKSVDVKIRVVAATNKDLREEVNSGRFRADLFYRLQVVPLSIPSLRERGQDAFVLARWFLERFCKRLNQPVLEISPEVEAAILSYAWPGNVRELENLMERLALLADGPVLLLSDLPEELQEAFNSSTTQLTSLIKPQASEEQRVADSDLHLGDALDPELITTLPSQGVDFNDMVNRLEHRLISLALNATNGNKKAAAELLKLNRTTLVEKMRKKGLLDAREKD